MLGAITDIIFPPVCPLCEEETRSGPFCRTCLDGFERLILTGPLCTVCGEPFAAGDDHPCGECEKSPPPFNAARSVFRYEGAVLDAVHALKYNGRTALADGLGALMAGHIIRDSAVQAPDAVIPVPLHPERLRRRGFNHALLLARAMARSLTVDAPVDYTTLERTRKTAPQVGLSTSERTTNVAGAFSAGSKGGALDGRTVLLVDDVYTTGATVAACARALVRAGAGVEVVTLARAVKV